MPTPPVRKLLPGLAVAATVLLACGWLTFSLAQRAAEMRLMADDGNGFLRELSGVRALMIELEAGARSHIATGDDGSRLRFQETSSNISQHFEVMADVASRRADLRVEIERLKSSVDGELASLTRIVSSRGSNGAESTGEPFAEWVRLGGLAGIRQQLQDLEHAESRRLYDAARETERNARLALGAAGAGAVLPLTIVACTCWLGLRLPQTVEKRVESGQLESSHLTRRVIEASGDWVSVLDLEGCFISMNAEGCRAMEIGDLRTLVGQTWLGMWRGDGADPARAALAAARAGEIGRFTAFCPTVNDAPRWWSVLVRPVLGATGACEKLLTIARDITAGKQAEEKFRALFQRSVDAHCILDDHGIFECNDTAVRGLGYSKVEELTGLRLEQTSPDTQPDGKRSGQKIAEAIQLARRTGHCRFAWTFRRQGQDVPAEVSLTPINLDGRKALFAVWRDLSERQQAETALRESESRFQQFMEHSPFAAFIKDTEGRLIYVNRKFEQGHGRKAAEVIGKPAFGWLPAETARRLTESDEAVLKSGQPAEIVEPVPLADGRTREWLLMKFPIKSESGRTLLGGVGIDVTDQRGAERQLQQSESQFRDLFDDAPVAYHELDLKNRITRVNKTELTLLGYTAEEMVGRLVWDFIVEDRNADPTQGAGDSALDAYQRTLRRKDGKTIPVLMRHKLIKDGNGLICGMRSTLQDISALKRKEEQLLEAEEKYRSIFEHAVEGIFQSTGEGAYINANPALAEICGYDSPDDLMCSVTNIGRQLYVDPQRRAAFAALMNERGAVTDFESEIRRKDGSHIWISERARAVRDQDGKLLYYEGTVEDVTARRETDAAITQARDAALESARLKTEFLANMSHEIRTPMNGVIGMTGLLLDTDLQPKQREFAETITSSAESLVAIINDILDFSKIEAGMLAFEEIDFQLGQAVEAGVDLLAERAAAKEVELACLIHSDVPMALRGDPGRLRQVITNLVGNAVKFTDKGEVFVQAKKADENTDSVLVRFTVRDTGVGISKEAQGKLFQAFVQADGSTTRKFGGTGLGLAICKQLVRQMDGEIGVESEPGKGATFWFTARFPKQPKARPVAIPQIEILRKSRILVVDDNATNRSVIHHLLNAAGVHEELAVSGAEALVAVRSAAAKNQPFDAVLVDMQMPEMDGMALAKAIKQDRRLAQTPLVMMTCRDRRDDPEAMRDVGIDAYVTKPLKRAALFDCLRSVLAEDDDGVDMDASLVALKRTPSAAAPMAGLSLRILVAEDNEVNQKVALHQLKKIGFAAEAVINGTAALAALRKQNYDIIFMDCQMPELDGYETTKQLRRIEGDKRHTWVVAMTANTLEGDREKCIASGMDDYVAKPVKTNDMLGALNRYVQATDRGPAAEKAPPPAEPAGRAGTQPAIDPAALAAFREMDDGDGRILDQLIAAFLDNTPKVLAEGQRALEQRAALQVARCAHSLKGSCSNFGAAPMRDACLRLEKLANTGNLAGAPEMLSEIQTEFERVRIALGRERSTTAV